MASNENEKKPPAANTQKETPESLEVDGKNIAIDMHSFLTEPNDWNRLVAIKQVDLCDVDITDEYWLEVNCIRDQYEYNSCVLEVRHLLKHMKETLDKECATRKYLYKLFPYGYAVQACRIVGTCIQLKTMLDL